MQNQVMQALKAKYDEALYNEAAAAKELERLEEECARICESGAAVMSPELLDNTEDRGIVKGLLRKYTKQVEEWAKVIYSYELASK